MNEFLATAYAATPTLNELGPRLAQSTDGWRGLDRCPACDAHSPAEFAVIRGFRHSRCRGCGFTFINPLPPDELLAAFYNSDYYANYRRFEARRIRLEPYFSISMYTDPRRLATWLGDGGSLSVLDFGCGPGSFLALLRDEFGFQDVHGLDINRDSAEIARRFYGIPVAGSIDELRRSVYDVVLLIEVIEHIPDPAQFLSKVATLIKPGGRLLITTPAVGNPIGRWLPAQCPHYVAPNHVSLFTQRSLRLLLERCSLQIERIELDEEFWLLTAAAYAAFYELDFASPTNDGDQSDLLYRPNALGRRLGLSETRHPYWLPFRLIARAERLVAKFIRIVRRETHLYVLARRL